MSHIQFHKFQVILNKMIPILSCYTAMQGMMKNLLESAPLPGIREISPVSIYGEVYGGKDFRKICVLSLEWKREGVIDSDRCGDDSVDGSDLCRVVRRWKTRICGRGSLKEWGSSSQKTGCCMLIRTVCNYERWRSRWSGYGDNRRWSSTTSLKRYVGWEVVRTL